MELLVRAEPSVRELKPAPETTCQKLLSGKCPGSGCHGCGNDCENPGALRGSLSSKEKNLRILVEGNTRAHFWVRRTNV